MVRFHGTQYLPRMGRTTKDSRKDGRKLIHNLFLESSRWTLSVEKAWDYPVRDPVTDYI